VKFKKLILIVLLIGFVSPVFPQEEEKNEKIVIFRHDFMSRYVLYPFGIDFVPNNNMFNMLGGGVYKKDKFSIYNYAGKSKDYAEIGLIFDYILNLTDNVRSKTTFFGVSWWFLEEDEGEWGVMISEEIGLQATLNPSIGYAYLWVSESKEFIGHFFYVGISDQIKGVNWEVKLGYNKEFCVDNVEGFTFLLGLSKTISWTNKLFTDFSIRYYLNDKEINENEIVFGISTSIIF